MLYPLQVLHGPLHSVPAVLAISCETLLAKSVRHKVSCLLSLHYRDSKCQEQQPWLLHWGCYLQPLLHVCFRLFQSVFCCPIRTSCYSPSRLVAS